MAMAELVLIDVTGGSPVVLHVTGELDIAAVDDLEVLAVALADCDLVIDLAGVTFVDASGIGALIRALRRSQDSGRWFAVRSPTAPVAKALQVSGADRVLPIQDGDGRPWLASTAPAAGPPRGQRPADAGRARPRGRRKRR